MKSLIILISILFFACNNNASNPDDTLNKSIGVTTKLDTITSKKIGSSTSDTYINHPTGYKDITKFQDTTVNGIRLNDCDTITKIFGNSFKLLPDLDDLPSLQIVTRDKTQLLTMYMWNGNAKCDFSQYQIEYLGGHNKFIQKPFLLNTRNFISGRKITLGITKNELISMIGQPNETTTEKNITTLSYQEYNNLYFADYYFKNNKLFKFRFGEKYP